MNKTLTFNEPDPQYPLRAALADAAKAAEQLAAAGCEIHAAFDNGRRMVLLIDKAPPFVSGSMKRHHPNGVGGTTTVFAATYLGCQLEWMVDTQAVRHG